MAGISATTKMYLTYNVDRYNTIALNSTTAVNSPTTTTLVKKLGAGSGEFDGNSTFGYKYSASDEYHLSNNDFTIDFFFRARTLPPNDGATLNYLLTRGNDSDKSYYIALKQSAGQMYVVYGFSTDGASWTTYDVAATIVTDTWYHVEFARYGTSIGLYFEGVRGIEDFRISTNSIFASTDTRVYIAAMITGGTPNNEFDGYIDNVRIDNGYCWHRPSTVASFSIPTEEYSLPVQGLKYYNGASWVEKPLKYYNGSAWVEKPIKYYNGSAWV